MEARALAEAKPGRPGASRTHMGPAGRGAHGHGAHGHGAGRPAARDRLGPRAALGSLQNGGGGGSARARRGRCLARRRARRGRGRTLWAGRRGEARRGAARSRGRGPRGGSLLRDGGGSAVRWGAAFRRFFL